MEQELRSILDNESNRKQYRYLLIDKLVSVSRLEILDLDNLTELLGEQSVTTVVRPDLSHDLNACPKLITLANPNDKIDDKLLHWTIKQSAKESMLNKRYVCFWAASELAPNEISEKIVEIGLKLGELMNLRFVPFYEPFRMQLLNDANLICPDWLSHVLACFSVYSYTTFTHQMRYVLPLSYTATALDLFLTEETKFFQKESLKLYHLSLAWHNLCHKQNREITDSDILKLFYFYQQGWIYGLTHNNDLFNYALIMMKYADKLNSDQISKGISIAKDDPGSLEHYFRTMTLSQE